MDQKDPERLIEQMGLARFLYFSRLANTDMALVYSLHNHDMKLRNALRPELEAVEFAMRNRYHKLIQAFRPGTPTWLLDERLPVCRTLRGRYDKVFRQLSAGEITPGEAIEGLSFGFWTQLTSKNFEHSMWTPYVRHVYPARTRRDTVHKRADAVRLLRNRVSHLDTVLDQPLRKRWADMLWLLDRLNPELAEERRNVSDLPDLLG